MSLLTLGKSQYEPGVRLPVHVDRKSDFPVHFPVHHAAWKSDPLSQWLYAIISMI